MYTGKDESQQPAALHVRPRRNAQQQPAVEPEEKLVPRTVRLLTRKLVGKNYFVVMDNFFSSVELFTSLLDEQIFCCGTLRENRKFFLQTLKKQNLKKSRRLEICTLWKSSLYDLEGQSP